MIAAAYLRVSTVNQSAEDRWGYHRQVEDIRGYAQREGLMLAGEYRDAITGTSVTRAGLTRLLSEASQYGAVIVSSIDRLARDIGAGYAVAEQLATAGLRVHSADMGVIDFEDESSTIQFGIYSTLSHAERLRIRKRTEAARLAMAEAGKLPSGIKTYGYESDGAGNAQPRPEQARVVRDIYAWRLEGETMSGIAHRLNDDDVPIARPHRAVDGVGIWHPGPVAAIVKNPAYKGQYVWTYLGRRYVIPVPPIVDEATWHAAQAQRRGPKAHLGWMLAGHVRCGVCGRRMHAKVSRRGQREWHYYRCGSDANTRPRVSCGVGLIPRRQLEATVEKAIRTRFTLRAFLEQLTAKAASVPQASEERAASLRSELDRARLAYQRGVYTLDEFADAKAKLDADLQALHTYTSDATVDLAALREAAKSLPVGEFLRAARVVVIATKAEVRFEFLPD